jgi:hypothetical protein
MIYRVLLGLAGIPASSMLSLVLLSGSATATQAASCDALPQKSQRLHHRANLLNKAAVFERGNAEAGNLEVSDADFSEAESDAAVALFGCDCSSCVRALRELQAQQLNPNSQGHCWRSMEQRVSPEEAESILQTLEAENATVKDK